MNSKSDILNLFPQEMGDTRPTPVVKTLKDKTYINVPYIISEENGVYTWINLVMTEYNYHYRGLVDSIVSLKYDISETLAILLNFMDDPKNKNYAKEYAELQKWRKHAKEYAKNYFAE